MCRTVYGDMHLKDLLGSIGSGFLSSATWPSKPKKHYNGLIKITMKIPVNFSRNLPRFLAMGRYPGYKSLSCKRALNANILTQFYTN